MRRDGVSEGQFNQTLSTGHKPHKIISYRDGVSESQLNQVLNIELDQMIEMVLVKVNLIRLCRLDINLIRLFSTEMVSASRSSTKF